MQQIHSIILQCARSCIEKSGVSHPGSLGIPESMFHQYCEVFFLQQSCDQLQAILPLFLLRMIAKSTNLQF